jgi:hypothetical protein
MTRRKWTAALVAGAFCALFAADGTQAQTEPAPAAAATPTVNKAKAKPKAQSDSMIAVTVVNSRAAGLIQLQAAETGAPKWVKIAGPLKAGEKAAASVPRGKNCQIDLHGTFDDGQSMDAEGVDVCANKTLNLKD